MGEITTMQMLRIQKDENRYICVENVNQVLNKTITLFALFENTAFFQWRDKSNSTTGRKK